MAISKVTIQRTGYQKEDEIELNSNILEWVKESKFALGYVHWFRRYSLM